MFFFILYNHIFVIWLYNMFLVHVNACDFADTMLIVVQINLIWFDLIITREILLSTDRNLRSCTALLFHAGQSPLLCCIAIYSHHLRYVLYFGFGWARQPCGRWYHTLVISSRYPGDTTTLAGVGEGGGGYSDGARDAGMQRDTFLESFSQFVHPIWIVCSATWLRTSEYETLVQHWNKIGSASRVSQATSQADPWRMAVSVRSSLQQLTVHVLTMFLSVFEQFFFTTQMLTVIQFCRIYVLRLLRLHL